MAKKDYLPKILETGANELEIIDFRMYELLDNNEIYEWILGVNVAKVREVTRRPESIVKSPGSPPEVEGIAKIRGEIVPIVNLAKWMKIREPEGAGKYVIVMEFLREVVGVIVHEAKRIRRIKWADIRKPPPSIEERLGGKIVGVIEIENGELLLLLDFEGILDELGMIKIFGIEEEVPSEELERKGKFTILVLDDSPVARKIIRRILEKDGHTVIEASSGLEGLDILNNYLQKANEEGKDITDFIQLIVSDIEMPGMDGLTFTRKVKEHPEFSKIPVIINTSLSDKATVDKAKFVNADAHLVKFDAIDLLKLVHKYAIKKKQEE
ncbi:two-component system, chemotaxis family, response regulator CheV [Persephonella hydrogeniphila]|uniref:Two-component system, chemotaxis family, response regulator CheV n=1 Tax=Persephonella hydrogeniphila TaxID=198703 RepID=A0A285NFA7_9AQUI|nr:chemotaxis protein [Persephonella hydrogeniphila]SNZ08150.1 two-component system, chemotaxis family, response regulator CheV [Persephonella hydrogeniphila]